VASRQEPGDARPATPACHVSPTTKRAEASSISKLRNNKYPLLLQMLALRVLGDGRPTAQ
jgi:hypothetical protein